MNTIRLDFHTDPISRAIDDNFNTRTIIAFTHRNNLVRAQKIVQERDPFGLLRLTTLDKLMDECEVSDTPVLRPELRPFYLYNALTQADKDDLRISSFRSAQPFIKRFFTLMGEWKEAQLSLDIDWELLYESWFSDDTEFWQKALWERVRSIRDGYRELLAEHQLTDRFFVVGYRKPNDLHQYDKVVVVNPLHISRRQRRILDELFPDVTILRKASKSWMRDGDIDWSKVAFESIGEELSVEVEVMERKDEVSLQLALADKLNREKFLIIDNRIDDTAFYRFFKPGILQMETASPVALDPHCRYLANVVDILSSLVWRNDDPVPLFPAHLLVQALECDPAVIEADVRDGLIERIKNESLQAIPLDFSILQEPLTSSFLIRLYNDLAAVRNLRTAKDLYQYILAFASTRSGRIGERTLRIFLETAGIFKAIDRQADFKGEMLLDGFLQMLESKSIHEYREGGQARLLKLPDADNIQAWRQIVFMQIQEGVLPSNKPPDFLFTDAQRVRLGLTTSEDARLQDLYRFICLCAGARRIVLAYRNDLDANLHCSSFAESLMLWKGSKLVGNTGQYEFSGDYGGYAQALYGVQPRKKQTTGTLSIPLESILEGNPLPLSFSGLQTLKDDPAAFCLRHLMRLEPLEISSDNSLGNLNFGNLVHEVIQSLFRAFDRQIEQSPQTDPALDELHLNAEIDRRFDWIMWDKKQFYYKIPCGYSRTYFNEILLPYLRASIVDFVVQFLGVMGVATMRNLRFFTERKAPLDGRFHNPELMLNIADDVTGEDKSLALRLNGRADLVAHSKTNDHFWIVDFKTTKSDSSKYGSGLSSYQTSFYTRLFFLEKDSGVLFDNVRSMFYFVMDSTLKDFPEASWDGLSEIIENIVRPVVINGCFTQAGKKTRANEAYLGLYGETEKTK